MLTTLGGYLIAVAMLAVAGLWFLGVAYTFTRQTYEEHHAIFVSVFPPVAAIYGVVCILKMRKGEDVWRHLRPRRHRRRYR